MFVAILLACGDPATSEIAEPVAAEGITTKPNGAVPLEVLGWLDTLRARRPELMTQHAGTVKDPAWQALVVRPVYRDRIIHSTTETYDSLVATEYTEAQREDDAAWATSLLEARDRFSPRGRVTVARYPNAYVGFQVGPREAMLDDVIYDYKVFFELGDVTTSLTPERYLDFVDRLDSRGFVGDSKIDLRAGQTRFQYNNVIVHAPSIEMALCAEDVGVRHFGPVEVLHVARGVDVVVDGTPTSWHQFLLTGEYPNLSRSIRDFVSYQTPIPTEPCPNP